MSIGGRPIGEGVALRLAPRADPAPAGFDDDHAEQVEAGDDAVTSPDVARRIERHQLDRVRRIAPFMAQSLQNRLREVRRLI
jgi:hypothetical protein